MAERRSPQAFAGTPNNTQLSAGSRRGPRKGAEPRIAVARRVSAMDGVKIKNPNREQLGFGCWWWGGTLRQTYVTQRLRTAANSCGKVRNPAPTSDNPTSSARPRSSAKCLSQDASSIPVCGIEPTSATPDRLAWLHSAEPAPGRTACFRSKRRKNASIRSADPWPVSSLAPKR